MITGLCAFPITPTDADGTIDTTSLGILLRRLLVAKVDAIGLLGSTGSYPYLTRSERRRAVEAAIAATGGETPLLVGVGALRTDEAVRLAQDAKAAGATMGLLAPVSYTPLTDDEVFEHFATVARESQLPLCIYDNPGTTHFAFSAALVGRISRLPGVVALKSPAPGAEAAAECFAKLREAVPEGFSVGYSVDANAIEALLAGGDAWYSVVAGLFPEVGAEMWRATQKKDAAEARRLNARLQPLWELFKRYSSLRVMYAAADVLDISHAPPPRPILPLAGAAREQIAAAIRDLNLN